MKSNFKKKIFYIRDTRFLLQTTAILMSERLIRNLNLAFRKHRLHTGVLETSVPIPNKRRWHSRNIESNFITVHHKA